MEETNQYVVVMRHGRRQDSEQPGWSMHAKHPWDTPLSARGIREVDSVCKQLAHRLSFKAVVCSPFLRCLQTTAAFLNNIPPNCRPEVVVDPQLCEIYAPRLLHITDNPTLCAVFGRWRWQRGWRERATSLFARALPNQNGPYFPDYPTWPRYPESDEAAHKRFIKAIDSWADKIKGNVLIITHGDAVLGAVSRAGIGLADNVAPGGYVIMKRALGAKGAQWSCDPSYPHSGLSWAGQPRPDSRPNTASTWLTM